ncbi:hypothetical protein, partial [Seongchinamella unica]|uniref:hypothetical protein n=1 Tax=Seongchinamella unica TaxID=2547392 RepID=UPI001EED644C
KKSAKKYLHYHFWSLCIRFFRYFLAGFNMSPVNNARPYAPCGRQTAYWPTPNAGITERLLLAPKRTLVTG